MGIEGLLCDHASKLRLVLPIQAGGIIKLDVVETIGQDSHKFLPSPGILLSHVHLVHPFISVPSEYITVPFLTSWH